MREAMLQHKIDGTVLVVDDEPAVRTIHQRILQKYAISVFTAQDGQEALEIFNREDNIPIIITDINMPRMNGFELIMNVLKKKPLTQIIVITAHLDDTLALYGVKSNVVCLPKPVEPEFVAIATVASGVRYREMVWQQELKNLTLNQPWDDEKLHEVIRKAPWLSQV